MQLKYYSEILNRYFDSPEACEAEESKYKAKVEAENSKKSAQSARKKAAADKIEAAEKERVEAYKNYEAAKAEIQRILDESNEKMSAILNDAKKRIASAERAKLTAISEFNKEFGPYKVCISDDKARAEYNSIVNRFFNMMF